MRTTKSRNYAISNRPLLPDEIQPNDKPAESCADGPGMLDAPAGLKAVLTNRCDASDAGPQDVF